MPYRLFSFISQPAGVAIDGMLLGGLALWQGAMAFISDDSWSKITGPHGLIFALVVGLIVIWTKSVKDDAARERRHKENMQLQEEHFKTLIHINQNSSKELMTLSIKATEAQLTAANAIITMEKKIGSLADEIATSAMIVNGCSLRAKAVHDFSINKSNGD